MLLVKAYLRLGPSSSNPQIYVQKIQVKQSYIKKEEYVKRISQHNSLMYEKL